MFVYPYDTSVCQQHVTSNIIKAIKTAEAVEGLTTTVKHVGVGKEFNVGLHDRNILLVTAKNKEVPPFAHSLLVDFVHGTKLVVDARSFSKVINNEVVITSDNEYKFNIIRTALTDHMVNGSVKDLLTLGTFPMLIYARWIAENVSKRLGLNPGEQAKLVVIASFFYASMFRDDPVFSEVDLSRHVQLISKVTYIPVDICQSVADQILPMSNLKEFVSQIISIVDSPRLETFSTGLLMTVLMNSWFGVNSKEIVCVSLEHMPTWYSLIYSALNDRSYHTCALTKIVLANDKKEMGKNFSLNLLNLVS